MRFTGGLNEIKARFVELGLTERPFFVAERNWRIFCDFAQFDRTVPAIAAEHACGVGHVRKILHEVDRQLSLPRPSLREWEQVTANSPIEDLALSVRALNRLRDLHCCTVEDILRIDFTRPAMGQASRTEVLDALRRCGFGVTAGAETTDLDRVTARLTQLKAQIDESVRSWMTRVENLESRVRRLASGKE